MCYKLLQSYYKNVAGFHGYIEPMDLDGEVDDDVGGGASVIEEEVGEDESQSQDSSDHVCQVHESADHGLPDYGLSDLANAPPLFDIPCDEVNSSFI